MAEEFGTVVMVVNSRLWVIIRGHSRVIVMHSRL